MKTWARLLFSATALSTMAMTPALAADLDEKVQFSIAPGSLDEALIAYSNQADLQVISASSAVRGKRTAGVSGDATPREALAMLLKDSGLSFAATSPTTVTVSADPQGGSAAGAGAEVEALIVTAQKREEDIQDVPIAISAFSQKELEAQKIEGGFDLLKAIPNVTFSKSNFTSYNFSIRGVGTKAISATTDPGVAVSFNNVALLQNRLFEQEYFDVERVEVLRGPQGTLYGRNATSGVINVISAKPDLDEFAGWLKGEVGNYHTKRISAMVNVPLIENKLAMRFAGSLTDRQGYDYNTVTKQAVNGRDLWSGRITVGFNPTENIRTSLIWERFSEDDDRSRTGKQLCHHDEGPAMVGATPVGGLPGSLSAVLRPALFGQGCKPGSLYDDGAFGTPNGLSLPFVFAMLALGADPAEPLPPGSIQFINYPIGLDAEGRPQTLIQPVDPYGGMMQSRNLREIASFRNPVYRADADVVSINIDFDLSSALTLSSQTVYNHDTTYSFQDFNRFNTKPVFTDTSQLQNDFQTGPSNLTQLAPGGIFCDPQLGCSNTLAGFDIAQAEGTQWTQELRLQSDFEGALNFSVGSNYTKFETLIDYYVFYNLITAFSMIRPFNNTADIGECVSDSYGLNVAPQPIGMDSGPLFCPYIDPNPIELISGEGHNYFRSKNPYSLESWSGFGELYADISNSVRLTAGLRYTQDRKRFVPVPSQVLLAPNLAAGGSVAKGYPADPPIKQEWGEWTGRFGLDWRPNWTFTDDSMIYAFYSRGYKGGGANPPGPGFADEQDLDEMIANGALTEFEAQLYSNLGIFPILQLTAVEYGPTFDPEFVNAYEIGAKNTLMGGALTANMNAFYYDYEDYQVSHIRDRTAVNENFDATIWGLEFQTLFSPGRDFQIVANLGYLDTRIADGETSIDIMNRTQGDSDYVLVKPWAQLPSNCVVPTPVAERWLQDAWAVQGYYKLCGGVNGILNIPGFSPPVIDPNPSIGGGALPYDPANYPELNGGAGLLADVGGNELPNAPHWTANIGAQYGFDVLEGWRATVRADAYWQSQSWARVYNADPYDKLHGWYNVNLSVWVENDDGLKIEFYAKNLLDKTPITDAFLNSDDTALTTNVFVLDPRLIGLSIRKEF